MILCRLGVRGWAGVRDRAGMDIWLEARWLRALDRRRGRLAVEDIAAAGFDPAPYGRTLTELMGSLHGVFPAGRQTTGVETFRQAHRAVGLGWVLAPTRWPALRPLCDEAAAAGLPVLELDVM